MKNNYDGISVIIPMYGDLKINMARNMNFTELTSQ